jgi:hypothetical protein
MNVKSIIIAVVLLAGGGGAYYAAAKDNSGSDSAEQASSSQSLSGSKSINELLAGGQNLQCSYSYMDDEGNKSSGTTYISGSQMRGSFTIDTGQGTQNSNVLRDSQYQYIWQDGSNTGFKTAISALGSAKTEDSNQASQTVDQNRKYDFDCTKWRVDKSVFKAPGNVKFTGYSKQLQQSGQPDSDKDKQEAACENLTGEARDACQRAY